MSKTKSGETDTQSFPGYATADAIFVSWANALRAQASSWNTLWGKLRGGNAGFGDWSKLFVESVEATMSFSEQLWLTVGGSASPPWVNLPFPPKAAVPVRIRKAVSVNNAIEAVPLVRLGGGSSGGTTTHPVSGSVFEVHVSVVGPYELNLFVDDGEWTTFQEAVTKDPPQHPVQYVGLVFSEEHADPIAIVSFRVSAEDVETLKKSGPPEMKDLVKPHLFGGQR